MPPRPTGSVIAVDQKEEEKEHHHKSTGHLRSHQATIHHPISNCLFVHVEPNPDVGTKQEASIHTVPIHMLKIALNGNSHGRIPSAESNTFCINLLVRHDRRSQYNELNDDERSTTRSTSKHIRLRRSQSVEYPQLTHDDPIRDGEWDHDGTKGPGSDRDLYRGYVKSYSGIRRPTIPSSIRAYLSLINRL